ncbi:MAG TPA: energy transducer TonB [Candidatus Acidoferrales bacterium]|nr:energy transducer TonB [Candidatus Acidoferrales bacterium]
MSVEEQNTNQESQGAFTLLASGKPRWRSFGTSFVIEIIILLCAIWIPALFPKQMEHAAHYVTTHIDVPYIPHYKPQPIVKPKFVPVKHVVEEAKLQPPVVKEQPVIPDPPKPKVVDPVFAKLNAVPAVRHNKTEAPKVNEWARMEPDVKTNSMGSSAMPTITNPRTLVQTGGFGDPNGLPATNSKQMHPVNINAAGDFNLPQGPGKGNGRGGAKGKEGVVASAGFGNQTAIAGGQRNGGKVETGGFSNQQAASSGPRKKAEAAPQETPVVIQFKPEPQYTAEGRAKRIQGSVVLEVVFKASGEVQVLRVVKGLGYGLDENAETAARQIKFTPSKTADGQPVDFPATVRIDFELAY